MYTEFSIRIFFSIKIKLKNTIVYLVQFPEFIFWLVFGATGIHFCSDDIIVYSTVPNNNNNNNNNNNHSATNGHTILYILYILYPSCTIRNYYYNV